MLKLKYCMVVCVCMVVMQSNLMSSSVVQKAWSSEVAQSWISQLIQKTNFSKKDKTVCEYLAKRIKMVELFSSDVAESMFTDQLTFLMIDLYSMEIDHKQELAEVYERFGFLSKQSSCVDEYDSLCKRLETNSIN
jgi:hypothetical protein